MSEVIKHSPHTATVIKFAERMAHRRSGAIGTLVGSGHELAHRLRLPMTLALTVFAKMFCGVRVFPNSFHSNTEKIRFEKGDNYLLNYPTDALLRPLIAAVPTVLFIAMNPELNLKILIAYLTATVVRDTVDVHKKPTR